MPEHLKSQCQLAQSLMRVVGLEAVLGVGATERERGGGGGGMHE